jgi:tetratricopeptide (TPR) repeat protein
VLQLDPTNGWAFLDRGRTYKKMGQLASARIDFESALRVPDLSPELRRAVSEEMPNLAPPSPLRPPPPPPPDLRPEKLSALTKIRNVIEQRLPTIHFPALRRRADEVLAKLASANPNTSIEELDNLTRSGNEIIKQISEMDEFASTSSIATRQKERVKNAIRYVVTDAPYLEEILDAVAMLEGALQSDNLPALQSALGNLNRVYERYQMQIKRDTPDIP